MPSDPKNNPRPGDLQYDLLRKILDRLSGVAGGSGVSQTYVTNYVAANALTTDGAHIRNLRVGQVNLQDGDKFVSLGSITGNSMIFLSFAVRSNPGFLAYTLSAGSGFTITSSDGGDNSTVNYLVLEFA